MVQITTAIAAEKTSSTVQSELWENCKAKARKLCQTYQSFNDFASKNNPDTQVLFGSNEQKSIMDDYSTLEQIDLAFGEGKAASWLLIAIADLNVFSGSKKMDDAQMKSLASLIAQRYSHLKYSVLQLFFYKFANGFFTVLHNNRKQYLLTALSAVAVIMISVRYCIVTETVFIILIAANFYPNRIRRSGGNGGLRLSKPERQRELRIAA